MMLARDVDENKRLSEHGAKHIITHSPSTEEGYSILTHCNTGSLATAGYGTALGELFMHWMFCVCVNVLLAL